MPALAHLMMTALNHQLIIPTKVILAFYSFWNIDILHSAVPDICFNVTNLQAFALDYLVALYPFVLKCACIVVVWKPFHKVLTIFQKS